MRSFITTLVALSSLSSAFAAKDSKPFMGQGEIHVLLDGQDSGCLNSRGAWVKNECATYSTELVDPNAGTSEGFQVYASKDDSRGCWIKTGVFFCSPSVSEMTLREVDGFLSNNPWSPNPGYNSTHFWAKREPSRNTRSLIYDVKAPSDHPVMVRLQWVDA